MLNNVIINRRIVIVERAMGNIMITFIQVSLVFQSFVFHCVLMLCWYSCTYCGTCGSSRPWCRSGCQCRPCCRSGCQCRSCCRSGCHCCCQLYLSPALPGLGVASIPDMLQCPMEPPTFSVTNFLLEEHTCRRPSPAGWLMLWPRSNSDDGRRVVTGRKLGL